MPLGGHLARDFVSSGLGPVQLSALILPDSGHPTTLRTKAYIALFCILGICGADIARSAEHQPAGAAQEIRVIGVAPLPGKGVPLSESPSNSWSLDAEHLGAFSTLDLSDTLTRRIGSFNINGIQSNPYQNDLFYRGFLVSPLVGTANALSAYLDGVRINEGFGGTLNWDLIPESALARLDVVPGSNPVFGRNTLGGALVLRTKSGRSHPGTFLQASGGAFGRREVELAHGGAGKVLDWYLHFSHFDEDGWRRASPSEVRKLFGKLGFRNRNSSIDLHFSHADNTLVGNGLAPETLLQSQGRDAVHTQPDQTRNTLHFFNLVANHAASDGLQLVGNFYRRDYRRRTVNGDAELSCEARLRSRTAPAHPALGEPYGLGTADGGTLSLIPDNGEDDDEGAPLHLARCNKAALGTLQAAVLELRDALAEDGITLPGDVELAGLALAPGGELRNTDTHTDSTGLALQLHHSGTLYGRENTLTLGLAYDHYETRYTVREASAMLGGPLYATSVAPVALAAADPEVDVRTKENSLGFYIHNVLDLSDRLHWTISGRYQYVDLSLRDLRLDESGFPEDALNGDHRFSRFSPATGISYETLSDMTIFARYGEGFRSPTAAELSCADEEAPCNLPNAFVADPPLEPVIAKTYELGARGTFLSGGLQWRAALFRTTLSDDLLFIHTRSTGAGFFQNIADTRRQGLEAGLSGRHNRLDFFANYSYLEASIESDVVLSSAVRAEGTRVRAGDILPGIPRHNLRMGFHYQARPNWQIGSDMRLVSRTQLRGDEGHQGLVNGAGEELSGRVSGYAVWNVHTILSLSEHIGLWGTLENVLDKEYATGGAYNFNANAERLGRAINVERFLAPGAPRAAWAGLRVTF